MQTDDNEETVCKIDADSIDSGNVEKFLPLEFCGELSEEKLVKWLKHRTVPANRYYVKNFLSRLGLAENDICGIISVSYGLSLNDCYWLCPEAENRTFDELNLYDNRFSTVLGAIAFTGYGSYLKTGFRSSPEFTTNGMLAKAWRRLDGKILLYKSGTVGAANTGLEPYSEFYAWQVAKAMQINAIPYGLSKWKGRLCSTCGLFTSKDLSFVPAGNLIKFEGINSLLDYYKNLGGEFYDELVDMFIFDAIILNQDRHMGNFGFLVDNRTNKIAAPSPIFDNGLSLFCYAMDDDIKNYKKYSKTVLPALYPDFQKLAAQIITHRQRGMLQRLLDFKFKKHPHYNLPDSRLDFLSFWIRERAKALLKM
ncbi:MAG: hypothetical protein J5595_01935 [Bacteroidales bacterium]|nr:hypothetical protein [Bacteroidales bacterium]